MDISSEHPNAPRKKSSINKSTVTKRASSPSRGPTQPATWLSLSFALFILSSAGVVFQTARPSEFSEPLNWTKAAWWIRPLEFNAARGLPEITGDLNAVEVVQQTGRIWVGGNSGFLAFSDDRGHSWVQLKYDSRAASFAITTSPPAPPCGAAGFLTPSRVFAAGLEERENPPVKVPNLIGQDREYASSMLLKGGLTLGKVTEQDSTAPPGQVIEQSPKPDAS